MKANYQEPLKIWQQELGGIRHKWIRCSDGIARCLGRAGDSDEEMMQRAERTVQAAQHVREIEAELHAKYPGQQLIRGWLPAPDILFEGEEGEYIYVLSPRRKNKKYTVKAAIGIR